MPHDCNGTELQVGDVVSIDFIVTGITSGVDYCNINAKSSRGRLPDGLAEHFSGNAAVCRLVLRNRKTNAVVEKCEAT